VPCVPANAVRREFLGSHPLNTVFVSEIHFFIPNCFDCWSSSQNQSGIKLARCERLGCRPRACATSRTELKRCIYILAAQHVRQLVFTHRLGQRQASVVLAARVVEVRVCGHGVSTRAPPYARMGGQADAAGAGAPPKCERSAGPLWGIVSSNYYICTYLNNENRRRHLGHNPMLATSAANQIRLSRSNAIPNFCHPRALVRAVARRVR
jgi:hypothetical protein